MKRKLLAISLCLVMMMTLMPMIPMTALAANDITADFDNLIFRDAVRNAAGLGPMDSIKDTDAAKIIYLDVSNLGISSLDGIEHLVNLKFLDCSENQLSTLELSGCSDLVQLYCSSNQLSTLDLSGCSDLVRLSCSNNQLSTLDLSGCPDLVELSCGYNQLSTLDLFGFSALEYLSCESNQLRNRHQTNWTTFTDKSYWMHCSWK